MVSYVGEVFEVYWVLDLWIEVLDFCVGVWVEGQYFVVCGVGVEYVVDFQWGVFVGQFEWIVGGWQVVGMDVLGFFELVDVGWGDLF